MSHYVKVELHLVPSGRWGKALLMTGEKYSVEEVLEAAGFDPATDHIIVEGKRLPSGIGLPTSEFFIPSIGPLQVVRTRKPSVITVKVQSQFENATIPVQDVTKVGELLEWYGGSMDNVLVRIRHDDEVVVDGAQYVVIPKSELKPLTSGGRRGRSGKSPRRRRTPRRKHTLRRKRTPRKPSRGRKV